MENLSKNEVGICFNVTTDSLQSDAMLDFNMHDWHRMYLMGLI